MPPFYRIVLLLTALFAVSCGERYSPWQTNVPAEFADLTAVNLAKVQSLSLHASSPLTIALLADPQGTPDDFREVIDTLNRRDDIDLILIAGDLTDHGLLHEYIWAAKAITRARAPIFTVIGNHDAISHGKEIYRAMFGPFNYTFARGGFKFVMFNNNKLEFGSLDFPWLRREVDDNSIVVAHIPMAGTTLGPEDIAEWEELLAERRAAASLHGHRGSKRGFLSEKNGQPYYVAPRVRGVRYALLKLERDQKPIFKECRKECGTF